MLARALDDEVFHEREWSRVGGKMIGTGENLSFIGLLLTPNVFPLAQNP
jgi:hypothetical protein